MMRPVRNDCTIVIAICAHEKQKHAAAFRFHRLPAHLAKLNGQLESEVGQPE